jgi:hypothetical protein|nr:MAG TPA: tail tube protein [Caudoviricetes sp.]
MAKVTLRNIPATHDGNGYITIDGRRVDAFQISKLSLQFETITDEKRFLEHLITQHAARGGTITGNLTYYNCTSAFIKAVEAWKNGDAEYPDITLQSYAQINGRGRQEVIVTGVILKNVGLISLDDSSDTATTFDTDLTAEDFQTIESFKE